MATIPTFLYVGSNTVNGAEGVPRAEPGIAALGGFFLLGYDRERYNTPVGSPTTYQPYWDETAGKPNHEGSSNDGQFQINTGATSTVIPLKLGALVESYVGMTFYMDASGAGGSMDGESSVVQSQTATSVTVSPALTTAPTENFVCHIGTGAWKTYRAIRNNSQLPGTVYRLGGNGDNHASGTIGGFGPSLELMPRLAELYPTAPNFRLMKMAFTGGLAAFNGGASWTKFDASATLAMSAGQFGQAAGDTPTYSGIFVDFAVDDIETKSATYAADMLGVVALLRTKFGTDVPIWFVNPPESMWSESKFTADGFTPWSRALRYGSMAVASLSPITILIDASTCETNAEPNADGTEEPDGYSVGGTLHMGKLLATAVESFNLPVPVVNPGTGLATYFLIGDSIGKGTIPFEAYLQSNQPSLLGATQGTSVRAGQWVYNSQSGQFELYDISANDNANGDPSSPHAGPSASMLRELGRVHTDGVLLIKVAKGGATLTNAANVVVGAGTFDPAVTDGLWDDLLAVRSAAIERVYGQLQRTLDVRGFATIITDNDIVAGSVGVAALQSDLTTTLQAIRDQFTTRTDWVMPIVALMPPKHLDDGGTSTHGTAANRQAVRDLWTATASSFTSLALVSSDDLELQYDKVHLGLEGTLTAGTRIAQQLLSMQSASGAAAGSGSGLTTSPAEEGVDVVAEAAAASSASVVASVETSGDIIAAIDQAIEDGGDVASYTVNGRTTTLRSLSELIMARKYYAAQSARSSGLRYTKVSF
jgi:hypothetical protein